MQKKYLVTCLIFFCLAFPSVSNAQNQREDDMKKPHAADTNIVISDTTNIELLFKRARELAYDQDYVLARKICQKILERKPNYYEVRTFLGRTYAWEKQYENARTELSKVLIEKENDYDALNALYDVEFWTESYSVAQDYLRIALGYYPTSEELLLKKAKLQLKLEDKAEATITLRRILNLYPGQKEAIKLMNSIEGRKLNNTFQVSMLVDLYDKKDPRYLYSSEYGRNFSFGTLIFRGNYANKFNKEGMQYELETYLHFSSWVYLNLLAGRSDAGVFPKENYNAELYFNLPKGFETSWGIRHLKYDPTSTNIYTASLSNYFKDYYINARAYVTPKPDTIGEAAQISNGSITVIANFRIYFGDSENFLGFKAGSGRSPDENKSLNIENFQKSSQVSIELQRRAFEQWLVKMEVTYSKEDQKNSRFTRRISTNLVLKTVF